MTVLDELDVPYQDWIVLAGVRSPGVATIRGAGSPRSWDIRQGYAFSGATVIFTGSSLSKFEVDIAVWTQAQFAAFDVFARATLALPAPVRNPASMSIAHPLLNAPPISIAQVVVEDVSQWEQDPDGGLWMRTIKMLHYRAPLPILVRPFKGPDGNPLAVKPPVDPRDQQIAANAARIAELGK